MPLFKIKYISIILGIVASIGLFFLVFTSEQEFNNKLAVVSNLLGTIFSLVTLLIAISLYDKYGIEKTIVNKQADTVLQFLIDLKTTRFILLTDHMIINYRTDLQIYADIIEDYGQLKLVFSRNYVDLIENLMSKTCENILFPKDISEKLKKLRVYFMSKVGTEPNTLKVSIPNIVEDGSFYKVNDKDINLSEYINIWDSITESATSWLKDNSNNKIEINFKDK